MWQTVDYKGNTVKWYEAELIEAIRLKCQNELCYNTQPCEYNYWVEQFAKTILNLIEENEK